MLFYSSQKGYRFFFYVVKIARSVVKSSTFERGGGMSRNYMPQY